MELSPQAVAAATFKTVKRGYDPDEVRAYLIEVSASLEASHQQATAMEARARAAIAKLQDATQNAQNQNAQHSGQVPAIAAPADTTGAIGGAEEISRTLLLAQRTADLTIAEAKASAATITEGAQTDAASLTAAAKLEAASTLEQARAEAARLLDEARTEAQRAKSEQHLRAEAEVKELQSRREALIADIDALDSHASKHRDRLRETSSALAQLADRVTAEGDRPSLRSSGSSGSTGGSSTAGAAGAAGAGGAGGASSTATPSLLNGDDTTGSMRIPPPPITGQVPLQHGVEPLVSPRPTSADEVRSMWQEAERAEQAGLIDATPVEGVSFDAPTPSDGIRR